MARESRDRFDCRLLRCRHWCRLQGQLCGSELVVSISARFTFPQPRAMFGVFFFGASALSLSPSTQAGDRADSEALRRSFWAGAAAARSR